MKVEGSFSDLLVRTVSIPYRELLSKLIQVLRFVSEAVTN